MVNRKVLLAVAAALWGVTFSSFATASDAFPNKTVRLVIAFPPGGATDTLARTLASHLAKRWKQSVVVENKPGGNTVISALDVAKAKPDGYPQEQAVFRLIAGGMRSRAGVPESQ